MADSRQFIEVASGASGIVRSLASVPSGADHALIRVGVGTVRWSQTTGSWINASIGLMAGGADLPWVIGDGIPLSAFSFVALGGAADIQVTYRSYRGIGQYL